MTAVTVKNVTLSLDNATDYLNWKERSVRGRIVQKMGVTLAILVCFALFAMAVYLAGPCWTNSSQGQAIGSTAEFGHSEELWYGVKLGAPAASGDSTTAPTTDSSAPADHSSTADDPSDAAHVASATTANTIEWLCMLRGTMVFVIGPAVSILCITGKIWLLPRLCRQLLLVRRLQRANRRQPGRMPLTEVTKAVEDRDGDAAEVIVQKYA